MFAYPYLSHISIRSPINFSSKKTFFLKKTCFPKLSNFFFSKVKILTPFTFFYDLTGFLHIIMSKFAKKKFSGHFGHIRQNPGGVVQMSYFAVFQALVKSAEQWIGQKFLGPWSGIEYVYHQKNSCCHSINSHKILLGSWGEGVGFFLPYKS